MPPPIKHRSLPAPPAPFNPNYPQGFPQPPPPQPQMTPNHHPKPSGPPPNYSHFLFSALGGPQSPPVTPPIFSGPPQPLLITPHPLRTAPPSRYPHSTPPLTPNYTFSSQDPQSPLNVLTRPPPNYPHTSSLPHYPHYPFPPPFPPRSPPSFPPITSESPPGPPNPPKDPLQPPPARTAVAMAPTAPPLPLRALRQAEVARHQFRFRRRTLWRHYSMVARSSSTSATCW